MPGRKPKPTELKIAHGNPGKRPINKRSPKFDGAASCPAWLTKEAKIEWKRVTEDLAELGMIKSVDQATLAAYCQSWARWQSAERIVDAEGQTVQEPITNKAGDVVGYKTKRHPATIIAKDERFSMVRIASSFGFDPASRSRIVLPEGKENVIADEDDSYLFASPTGDPGRVVH